MQRFLLLVRLCAHVSVIQLLRYCFSQVPPLKKEKQCKHKQHNTANIQAPVDDLFLVKLEVVGMRNSYLFACLLYLAPCYALQVGLWYFHLHNNLWDRQYHLSFID